MAIRDVGSKPAAPGGGSAGGLPPQVEKGLSDAGLTAGGKSSTQAANDLLGGLRARGFQAPAQAARGDLAMQLIAALKSFQQAQGLPPNGQLNAQTMQALRTAGVVADPQAGALKQPGKDDGFEKAPTLLKQGEKQRAEQVNLGTPDTNFLDALLNQLGPGGPNEGTSASDIKGAAQAGEAQSHNVDKQSKVSEAKKAQSADKKGTAADAKDNELATPQAHMEKGTGVGVKVSRGLAAKDTKTDEKRRKDALTGQDPTELGILDEEAEEDALEGAGDDGSRKRGKGGGSDGGQSEGDERPGSAGAAGDGSERDDRNASSGDDDADDARRGNAQTGDADEGAGHWRMPSLGEQAHAALAKITKDQAQENRATTYSWDVTFYKPGIYGAGQKAQELVHLVVDKATAFDPVWQKAHANLTALVKRGDPGGTAPSLDDIIQALRQARARDGDDAAPALKKITKPMGRI